MFFGTNKIQIQVGVLFNNEKCIVSNSSSPENYFQDIYSKNISKKWTQQIDTKIKFKKFRVYVSKFFDFVGSQMSIDNIFLRCSHILSNVS